MVLSAIGLSEVGREVVVGQLPPSRDHHVRPLWPKSTPIGPAEAVVHDSLPARLALATANSAHRPGVEAVASALVPSNWVVRPLPGAADGRTFAVNDKA
jgi:hypothetical protein